jgi:hypothetical protein
VLFDFEGEGDEELSVKKGDIILVNKTDHSGEWKYGRKINSIENGWVPTKYLDVGEFDNLLKDLSQF